MNMYALNNMAYVETVLGRPLYTFIYLTSGVAGAFASFLFSKAPSLGASGAVLGIFGAFWMYFENNKPYLSKNARQIQSSIQQVILANIAIGFFIANVDNWYVDLPFYTSPVWLFLASNVMFCLLQNLRACGAMHSRCL
jgi:membrane associated rhomboid family serine protease